MSPLYRYDLITYLIDHIQNPTPLPDTQEKAYTRSPTPPIAYEETLIYIVQSALHHEDSGPLIALSYMTKTQGIHLPIEDSTWNNLCAMISPLYERDTHHLRALLGEHSNHILQDEARDGIAHDGIKLGLRPRDYCALFHPDTLYGKLPQLVKLEAACQDKKSLTIPGTKIESGAQSDLWQHRLPLAIHNNMHSQSIRALHSASTLLTLHTLTHAVESFFLDTPSTLRKFIALSYLEQCAVTQHNIQALQNYLGYLLKDYYKKPLYKIHKKRLTHILALLGTMATTTELLIQYSNLAEVLRACIQHTLTLDAVHKYLDENFQHRDTLYALFQGYVDSFDALKKNTLPPTASTLVLFSLCHIIHRVETSTPQDKRQASQHILDYMQNPECSEDMMRSAPWGMLDLATYHDIAHRSFTDKTTYKHVKEKIYILLMQLTQPSAPPYAYDTFPHLGSHSIEFMEYIKQSQPQGLNNIPMARLIPIITQLLLWKHEETSKKHKDTIDQITQHFLGQKLQGNHELSLLECYIIRKNAPKKMHNSFKNIISQYKPSESIEDIRKAFLACPVNLQTSFLSDLLDLGLIAIEKNVLSPEDCTSNNFFCLFHDKQYQKFDKSLWNACGNRATLSYQDFMAMCTHNPSFLEDTLQKRLRSQLPKEIIQNTQTLLSPQTIRNHALLWSLSERCTLYIRYYTHNKKWYIQLMLAFPLVLTIVYDILWSIGSFLLTGTKNLFKASGNFFHNIGEKIYSLYQAIRKKIFPPISPPHEPITPVHSNCFIEMPPLSSSSPEAQSSTNILAPEQLDTNFRHV